MSKRAIQLRFVPRAVGAALWAVCALLVACDEQVKPRQTAEPGVIFTYPVDGQLDVPLGARIVVTFSEPIVESAVDDGVSLVGPAGPVAIATEISAGATSISITSSELQAGARYAVHVQSSVAPSAVNLPASGPLVTFTTRSTRPRATPPALVAVNGGVPAEGGVSFRPLFETTTIRLVFSEPLDPRSVWLGPGAIELLDAAGAAVPATLVAGGIHASIDPVMDLVPGQAYTLRLGSSLVDLGGQAMAPTTVPLTPVDSGSAAPIRQVLRTRYADDLGPARTRSGGVPNEIVIDKPLIGREVMRLLPSALVTELGDPTVLGGPIAFTFRKGQRLSMTGLDIELGGEIASGLSTGEVRIELLTDIGGRLYRNPHQPADQRPENERAPVYVDLSLDLAVFAVDPQGNATLTQTLLGVQASGTAIATEGVLAIELVAALEIGLLGITVAPTDMVLELMIDDTAAVATDTTAPSLRASLPAASAEHPVDAGIELIFDEPIDLDRARAGGIVLEDTVDGAVATVIESHGAAVVVRPRAPLRYSRQYRLLFADVADVAGNKLTLDNLGFATPALVATDVGPTASAVYPGVPCALTGATATSPGRCAGGLSSDDMYRPFAIAANEPIEVAFTSPIRRDQVAHGASCNTGNVRVELIDTGGACTGVVPGTLIVRDRSFSFMPDGPWQVDGRYRLQLVSGTDNSCGASELCGPSTPANFDPLEGTESADAGGPALSMVFTANAPTGGTFMMTSVWPVTDVNGSGNRESSEQTRDENRAALRITGTTGGVSSAQFTGPDCVPSTPERENCMYLTGATSADLGELSTACPLPGGGSAPSCIPVTLSPQAIYGTSVTMQATAGISLTVPTGTQMMRIREPASRAITGHIIDRGGTPTMVLGLDLYMDAPDMTIPLSSHDLYSKPLSVVLEGPLVFQPDGRLAIVLSNVADVPVEVNINAPLGISGAVKMIVPKGEMRLQLLSPAQRGVAL